MTEKFKWKTGIPNEHVHIIGETQGGEFTLCGDSFEIDITEFSVELTKGGLIETKERINCPDCLGVIKLCKSVKKSEMGGC